MRAGPCLSCLCCSNLCRSLPATSPKVEALLRCLKQELAQSRSCGMVFVSQAGLSSWSSLVECALVKPTLVGLGWSWTLWKGLWTTKANIPKGAMTAWHTLWLISKVVCWAMLKSLPLGFYFADTFINYENQHSFPVLANAFITN